MTKMNREALEVVVGGSLLVISFLISFLMVIDVLEKDMLLSILAFSVSFAGLLIGFHGIYGLVSARREK